MNDRISSLPRDVLDHILELLPVRDAARTCVLSQKWRYNWAHLPNLVLDKLFCYKLARESKFVLRETIDKILLHHCGDIVKFVLDVSETNLSLHTDIDRWISYVTRRNDVKKLTLRMTKNTTYKLPYCIFTCPALTHLKLFSCVFKAPASALIFQNLIDLDLDEITFVPTTEFCIINAPILVKLAMVNCQGTQYLKILSSPLKSLVVRETHYSLELSHFTNCKSLTTLYLVVDNPISYGKSTTCVNLLLSLPTVEVLSLGEYFLEILSAGTITKKLPFTLNCLWKLRVGINFGKIGQASYALELIKDSPGLSELEIWVSDQSVNDTVAVLNYLNTPTCLDQPLNRLKHVCICSLKGSKPELLFLKLLFAQTPSLERMSIKQTKRIGSTAERNIIIELARLPRASPKAELLYIPFSG